MSANAAALDIPLSGRDADRRPGMGRLTLVELRKMVDTRAGFWLQLTVVALTVIVPGSQRNETSSTTVVAPKRLVRPCASIMATASATSAVANSAAGRCRDRLR